MKQFNFREGLLSVALVGSAFAAAAQTQPLKFETGANGKNNWYANYVGVELAVVYPESVVGDKIYKISNDGDASNTNNWGLYPTTPIINEQIAMPPSGDSLAELTISPVPGSMTGKVALIYRGDTYFGDKAYYASQCGADACIIVNNIPGAPIDMGNGGNGSLANIPVFMISQNDGNALDVLYNEGVTIPRVTITTWGQNLTHDMGFVQSGVSNFPVYAMPFNQLANSNDNPVPYKNVDGAFIANFGASTETNATLRSLLQWTSTGGSPVSVRTDSAKLNTPFTVADSIFTLYSGDTYDMHATGTGRFDLTYTLSADDSDYYVGNNTATSTMYLTDDTWSKGTYDFTNNAPLSSIWFGPTSANETWGPYYYVNKGGYRVNSIQASFASASGTTVFPVQDVFTFYMFSWKDSVIPDGIIEAGELQLAGYTAYAPNGTTDSSDGVMNVPMYYTDPNTLDTSSIILRDTTWYWVCAVLESGSDAGYLGCDGVMDDYPRSYGRFHQRINSTTPPDSTYLEPYAPTWGDDGINISSADPGSYYGNFPFDNVDIDSVTFINQKGLIPSIAMKTSQFPTSVNKVGPVSYTFRVGIYPNPADANGVVNVNVTLTQPAKTVKYIVLDPLGRVVANVSHTNVQDADKLVIPTDRLSAGGYYVSVIVDGKNLTQKFVVTK